MDAEIAQALEQTTRERDALATEVLRREALAAAALEPLREQEKQVTAALVQSRLRGHEHQTALDQMLASRRVRLSARKHVLKVLQQIARGILAACTLLGGLMLSSLPQWHGLEVLGFTIASGLATWFLGDAADYLELDRD